MRDRDTNFTSSFDSLFTSIGVAAVKTPVRSPRANAFAERFVRTVRDDCLDHLLTFSRPHLEAVLAEYLHRYNRARPPRSLELQSPQAAPVAKKTRTGTIRRRNVLGGIIHEYELAA